MLSPEAMKNKESHYDSRGYTIDMTTYCNNRCLFCAASNRVFHKSKAEMRYELLKGREWGANRVDFTGGEPTLHPDIVELVAHAKRLGYETINLKTNGRKLANKDFLKKLVDAGLNQVLISVHGHTAEMHDALTQVKGSFTDAVKALENMVDLKVYFLTLTVLTTFNYKYLKEIVKFCYNFRKGHSFAYIYPVASAEKNFDIVVPRYQDAKPYLDEMLEYVVKRESCVNLDNIPLCVVSGFEQFHNSLTTAALLCHEEHEYRKKCDEECLYRPICEGVSPVYIQARGWDEFLPVKNQRESSLKEERKKVWINRSSVCMLMGQHAAKEFGGVIWTGTRLLALTKKGYEVIRGFSERTSVQDFARVFGNKVLGFLASLDRREMIKIMNDDKNQYTLLPQGNFAYNVPDYSKREPLPSKFSEFEYPLYEKCPEYPEVELT